MRITIKFLNAQARRLNVATGNPASYVIDGKIQIGHFSISQAYGGYCLHQTTTNGGSVRDVFNCGHIKAKDLSGMIRAYEQALIDIEWGDIPSPKKMKASA